MKTSIQDLQGGIPITMLIPLYARAVHTQADPPLIQDPHALEIMGQLDFDFSIFADDAPTTLGIAIRTQFLDDMTRAFLERHPRAGVINIAAGLDTRYHRMPTAEADWLELDLPEGIAIRDRFLPPSAAHRHLAHSALDFDWLTHPSVPQREQTLVIIEGLLMYFTENQVKNLLAALADGFPSGEILLEMVGRHMLTHQNTSVTRTGAAFQWGLDDPHLMESWHPRLNLLELASIYDRYPDRWHALYPDLPKSLAELRQKVTKIARLQIIP